MFEKATKQKLRFESTVGVLTTEDLWDLPLTSVRGANLNDVAKRANQALKAFDEDDFVGISTKPGKEVAQLRLDVVLHVIKVKQAEAEAKRSAKARQDEIAQLEALIAEKNTQKLTEAPVEELQARLAQLRAG